ncbi:MAG TPA: MFS transporter [Gemmatimonadota bacterium]|nr:MFS transporter [Gemmatimonadota bacterium]
MSPSDPRPEDEAPLEAPLASPFAESAPAPAATRFGGAFAALRHPNYRLFWVGALISNVGSWMQNVAQGWLVLELTDSAFMLGLVGFAGTVPMLVFLLVGGVYADRLDRRRLLIAAMSAMMVFAGVLALLTYVSVVRVWHVFVLSLLSGTGLAMAAPAYQAFVHDLVGRRDLQNAIALNSAQFNVSRILGPSLAGIVIGPIGLAGCFALNALSFLATIGALLRIRVSARRTVVTTRLWQSLVDGLQYARQRPRVRALLLLTALISVLAMPYSTLLPIIARDVLGLDASGLGYLFAIGGVGAVVGALSLAFRGVFPRRGLYLLSCVIATGAGVLALGLSRNLALAVPSLIVISFSATSSIALMNTLLQELVDDEMRGRVLGMYGLAFMGTFPIGNLLAGSLAGLTSASTALAMTGGALAVVGVVIAATRPRLRALE